MKNQRKTSYPVADVIVNRWSPRALSGEAISKQELMSLFEAARWAPSSYNNQPWYFVYALRDTPQWATLFDLLVAFNQSWAKNAAALVLIVSKDDFHKTGKPSRTSAFDTGAAWENMAIQAVSQGLVTHGMEGFDYDKAKKVLNIPDGYTVQAMVAVGKLGQKNLLPPELQEKEVVTDRKPLNEFVFEGSFSS
jgi:nitroreductase